MSQLKKVNQFLGERDGQQLKAEIYAAGSAYTINYFINGDFVKEEAVAGKSIYYVEDMASNWISGIKVLNG